MRPAATVIYKQAVIILDMLTLVPLHLNFSYDRETNRESKK